MGQIDELTMNSIGFAILCNFPQFCGMERAMEASEQFRAMKDELLAYRSAMTLEKARAFKAAEEQGLLINLPCKVGNKAFVMETEEEDGGDDCIFEGTISAFCVKENQVSVIIGNMESRCWFSETERRLADLDCDWFLTREEAEKALKEVNQND